MDLNLRLENIQNDIDKYFLENVKLKITDKKEMNIVLDIEACPSKDKTRAITYSIAIMSCDNDEDICYKYNDVQECLNMLLGLNTEKVNIYIHNLFYDIKPFIIEFIKLYGNNPVKQNFYDSYIENPFNGFKKEKVKILEKKKTDNYENFSYSMFLKKGQLYGATFYGQNVTTKKGEKKPIVLQFHDTFKIVPYSLQKCCSAFLDLHLPKDGLDYDKVRNVNDELTLSEKKYIYNDVFGLSYLVKKLIIDGFYANGKVVKYEKITNSSQSLYDYKLTLLEDFENKTNCFANEEFYMYVFWSLPSSFFTMKDKFIERKCNMLFKCVYPIDNKFIDGWIRKSYYGGLATVDFKNVKKFEKYKNKEGVVLDVNSLYPYQMQSKLLPYGRPIYSKKPYKELSSEFKQNYPLYIQEIKIYDMKLKKGKMAFVQVKDRIDFNGREVIEENINLKGEKVEITLTLCNPLLDLLFECYDVKSYKLLSSLSFRGANDLFKNYLDFWGEIKKTSTGANREIAKLRQNALYGKFGSSGDNEITNIEIKNGIFEVTHSHENYYSDTIYIAMSSFITSYAKIDLIKAINNNRERFMYCDTDSVHLFGKIEDVKGIKIDDKIYGYWTHEMSFNDFVYVGAKRYAEKNIENNKWEIKCCGLSDNIMKKVDDINVFNICEYSSKQLKEIKYYTKEDDIYYYKDKNCTQKIIGLIKSKKSKIVEGGTLILETPYQLTKNKYFL